MDRMSFVCVCFYLLEVFIMVCCDSKTSCLNENPARFRNIKLNYGINLRLEISKMCDVFGRPLTAEKKIEPPWARTIPLVMKKLCYFCYLYISVSITILYLSAELKLHIQKCDGLENIEKPSRASEVTVRPGPTQI